MFDTREKYRQAWDNAGEVDPSIPLNIDLELASVCNLTCPFCFISDDKFDEMIKMPSMDGKSRRRIMPTEMALRVIDESASIGVPALKFNWRGESTLHPDYSRIVQTAANRRGPLQNIISGPDGCTAEFRQRAFHDLLVNTNANCANRAIDGLMAATKVMVSLDSCRPDTYAIMRRGAKLERAIQVVLELIERGHPNVWVRRVMTKDNAGEDFLGDCRAIFGDKVKVSEHYCFDRNAESDHERVGCDHDDGMKRTYCQYPSQRIVVSSSGLCYPCCIDLHETMPVGDINKQSLLEIWNGDPMKKLRAELRQNKFTSPTCATCKSWMGYDDPKRASVQDIELGAKAGPQ